MTSYSTLMRAPVPIRRGQVVFWTMHDVDTNRPTLVLSRADDLSTARACGLAFGSADVGGLTIVATSGVVTLDRHEWLAVLDEPHPNFLSNFIDGSALVDGATYYLSDRNPGHLSRRPGRWRVKIGVAIGGMSLLIDLGPATRYFTSCDVVESVWLQSDGLALAFAFADGTDAVFHSNTRIVSVDSKDFVGPLERIDRADGMLVVTAGPFGRLHAEPPDERRIVRDRVFQVAFAGNNGAGSLSVRMLGTAERVDDLARIRVEDANGLELHKGTSMTGHQERSIHTWIPVPVDGEVFLDECAGGVLRPRTHTTRSDHQATKTATPEGQP